MKFTSEQRVVFERDGVVPLGQVLTQDDLAEYRRLMDQLFFEAPGKISQTVRDLSELRGQPRSFSVMQLVNMYCLSEQFNRLMRRTDFLDIAEQVLGPNIQLLRDQAFYKPALQGGEIYMHQDNRYWHLDPPSAMTLWIALDDATVESGCVHFIKGSHCWGRVQHRQACYGQSVLLEAEASKELSEPIEVQAGHATLHHCQTLHWSPPNRTGRPRRAHSIQYAATGITSRGGKTSGLPLLRGRAL